ncbi:MAG: lamin tail domain-containing protein [Bacteroidia bacterium]|nr:lamin tail domain-containing protein [Bacteroidia bacterium]
MNKYKFIFLVVFVALLQASCEKENTPETNVVINELLPVNSTFIADQNGEFDDWIELCNNSTFDLDLSGYFLSDSKSNLDKWKIPTGTIIPASGYLIIWADADTLQTGLHANFKLSTGGEKVYFSNPEILIIDKIEYPAHTAEIAFARNPDWSGSFRWQTPTFCASNNIHE